MTVASHIFNSTFVQRVEAILSKEELALLGTMGRPGRDSSTSPLGAFLDQLYSRAPSDFIRHATPTSVADAIKGCVSVISSLSAAPQRIAVELRKTDAITAIFLALDDHPFIITSVAERLHEARIQLDCFQHPILTIGDSSIAVSYIEVNQRCADEVDAIIPKIREALETLKPIVRDHREMISFVHKSPFSGPQPLRTEWAEISAVEGTAFLDWLASGSFFFIGVSTWGDSNQPLEGWGVWNVPGNYRDAIAAEVLDDLRLANQQSINISIHKLRATSIVHRRASLLHIVIKATANASNALSIIGYLTSRALACEALDIPLLRDKLKRVLAMEETPPNSHDYKYVIEVIDNMPTDDALTLPVSDLRAIAQLALGVFSQEDSRSATFIDPLRRRALSVVVLPPERYSADVQKDLQQIIESHLGATRDSSEIHLDSSKKRQLRLYVSTPLPTSTAQPSNVEVLGRDLQRATLSWSELLAQHLESMYSDFLESRVAFPEDYQAAIAIPEALDDYALALSLKPDAPLTVSLFSDQTSLATPTLTFISLDSSVSISAAVPVLENIGLEVLDANSYTLGVEAGEAHVLKCVVRAYDRETLTPDAFNRAVSPGLVAILRGSALDDPLNLLLRKIPITIEQISLLRAYCAFLWQTHKIATKRTMWKSLAAAPEVASLVLRMFDIAFNPKRSESVAQRKALIALEEPALQQALRKVPDITHDRILKALLGLVRHTVRTNFYSSSSTLAFKVASQRVDFMPHPRPLFEIFVFSPRIEGTHLRSSKVARGGIRWSERIDDYRSEVLGLMKTQKVKNVIIVPSGAKGGFVVKTLPSQTDAIPAAVEAGYREYISALLTLADNQVDGDIVSPPDCVIHDEPDPYFVVAADKGTATFSDIANSIAQNDFHFWLGDAFASGGSAGYDHKKYGITARGGWECVLRHCKDIGIDTTKPFTVVGIGDMSGDVFGNAMIISESTSLLGAFNHKHIFIDPSPDNAAAFKERQRLFALPRSQWSDFNASIISKGGGIFNRFDKEIQLTPEIRGAFAIGDDVPATVDGETLISLILKAPVDLLWNGGIGTYVKARSESNSDVNDGANDNVRINADELRARVVGEGGNLGLTQKARIEFALRGGRVNTDAIDNSGGVDLSDHEVNLKLLFSPLVKQGALALKDRNSLLLDISKDVVESVLQHNRDQALMLSMSSARSSTELDQYRYLIREMHRLGFLDRNRDGLPDEQELDMRAANKTGLTRPELSICSAAVKMWIKEGLRGRPLCADSSLEHFLLSYFPPRIRREFHAKVLEHPLRAEIISSELVGDILPAVGIAFPPNLAAANGASVELCMKSLLAADTILGARELRARLRGLDTAGNWDNFSSLWLDMATALRRASSWLLHYHGATTSLEEMVRLYKESFVTLQHHARMVFSSVELSRFEARVERYEAKGVSHNDAVLLSLYRRVIMVLEILNCAREYKQDVKDVAKVVASTLDTLQINSLFRFESSLEASNKWEQQLIAGSYQEIRRGVSVIAGKLLQRHPSATQGVMELLPKNGLADTIVATMAEVEDNLRLKRPFQVSVLPVVARQLRLLCDELS